MRRVVLVGVLIVIWCTVPTNARNQNVPALAGPVNDFAGVIDEPDARRLESMIRSLQQATGDIVVVTTVDSYAPFGDIREFAVKLFENGGRGIGERGKDNGLLVVLAVKERQVWVEVGYDLEQFITDGFAGQTSREYMVPEFRRGAYGAGLSAGVSRIVTRIAEGRNATLQGVRPPARERPKTSSGGTLLIVLFLVFILINVIASRTRRRRFGRRWGGGWSGWQSGVGPFGGPFGGGFGGFGGGGGGGFGGFGGGRSGGGGGGAGW